MIIVMVARHTAPQLLSPSYNLLKKTHKLITQNQSCKIRHKPHIYNFNSIPLIPACTARPGLPLSPPEIAFLESPYYRPQTASTTTSIADRHHPTNFHSVTYTQNDDAAFEAGSDNDHKSFLRMRVIFKVEYPAENVLFSSSFGRHSFEFRRVLTAARQQWTLNSDSELDFDGFVTVEFGENGRFVANLAPETMLIHFFFFSTGMPDVNTVIRVTLTALLLRCP